MYIPCERFFKFLAQNCPQTLGAQDHLPTRLSSPTADTTSSIAIRESRVHDPDRYAAIRMTSSFEAVDS